MLTNRRNIRHYLYGPDHPSMAAAEATLQAQGYTLDSRPAATGGTWLVLAEREEVVDPATVASARKLFEELASKIQGGDYDGWEAAIVES